MFTVFALQTLCSPGCFDSKVQAMPITTQVAEARAFGVPPQKTHAHIHTTNGVTMILEGQAHGVLAWEI